MFVLSGVPQLIKLIKTKKSGDISLLAYLLTGMALIITVVDAIDARDGTLLLSQGSALLLVLINLVFIFKYKKKRHMKK